MLQGTQHCVTIDDRSQIGEARRMAARLCSESSLSANDASRVAIVTTELATNVLVHGCGGHILLRTDTAAGPAVMIEILAIDAGPGMRDIDRCLSDGYSTGGTSGTGLGAVRRQADVFDAFSHPGAGTVVLARIGGRDAGMEIGAVCLPYPGEQLCGDAWRVKTDQGGSTAMVVDGLGHGPAAAQASAAAIDALEVAEAAAPSAVMTLAHERMGSTRGGAVAIARIDSSSATLRYCAIGNIAGAILGPDGSRGLFSHNGTVGAQIRQVRELEYPVTPGALMVLHSDGIATRWQLDSYPGIAARHPAIVSAVLLRDFRRTRDDATVLVVRVPQGKP